MAPDLLPFLTTPFWDTTWLRFLHIVGATAVLGSAAAVLFIAVQAQRAEAGELATYRRLTSDLAAKLVTPALFLTALIGGIAAFRFSERGLFDLWQQHWMFGGVIAWFLAMGVAGSIASAARRADGDGRPDIARPSLLIGLILVILVLMVFQPG